MSELPPDLEQELDEILASVQTDMVIVGDLIRRATELRAERWDPATRTVRPMPENWRGELQLRWSIDTDIGVGDGWRDLLVAALEKSPDREVVQIKEKFGEMRVYRLREMTVHVATASRHICEVCGAPGRVRQQSWIVTRCDQHVRTSPWDDAK